MAHHELKTWPQYFQPIVMGLKKFEVRLNEDRAFDIEDVLRLREWIPEKQQYTGNEVDVRVLYMMEGGHFGLLPNYVILSFEIIGFVNVGLVAFYPPPFPKNRQPKSLPEIKKLIEVYPPDSRRWCDSPERGGCGCMGCVRWPAPSTVRGDPEGKRFPHPEERLTKEEVERYRESEGLPSGR